MAQLQEWIYQFEEGKGAKAIKIGVALLAFAALAVVYEFRLYKNFATEEAMDSAQLARNLAEGKGYTTQFIRPLSIYLVRNARADHDPLLKSPHPDLANPPVYPLLLAGWMKILPFHYPIPDAAKAEFRTYQPEVLIAILNQGFYLLAALLLFFVARTVFDNQVATLSTVLFILADLFWRFSVSGLSTMFLVVVVLGIFLVLTRIEQGTRADGEPRGGRRMAQAALLGVLLGMGMLTRYSVGWLVFPVLVFLGLFAGRHRVLTGAVTGLVFLLVVSPWLVRNYHLSGRLFGTAGYAMEELSVPFPDNTLPRSLNPEENLKNIDLGEFRRKLTINLREALQNDLPKMSGSWLTAFFLVSLCLPFKNPSASRVRLFLIFSLAILLVVQCLGKTHLSADAPEINSENLLVLLAPMVFVFGSALFFILVDQFTLPVPELRVVATVLFGAVASAALIFNLSPPRSYAIAYPPYYPPFIQRSATWMGVEETLMSDMPWAVAWYGRRQCVWITRNFRKDFFTINDEMKPIQALYLTPRTTDSKFLAQMIKDRDGWGRFTLECFTKGEVMTGFPLTRMYAYWLPDQLFLTDWERWKREK